MVRKIEIILVDDIDGSAAAETVLFGIDGKHYEVDLSAQNATLLRDAMARYTAAARRAGSSDGRSARRSRAPGQRVPVSATAIRRWATDNGYKTSSRGRVPAPIVQAYERAFPENYAYITNLRG